MENAEPIRVMALHALTYCERLRWQLTSLMAREDDLLVVGLCAACGNRISKINPDAAWEADPSRFILI